MSNSSDTILSLIEDSSNAAIDKHPRMKTSPLFFPLHMNQSRHVNNQEMKSEQQTNDIFNLSTLEASSFPLNSRPFRNNINNASSPQPPHKQLNEPSIPDDGCKQKKWRVLQLPYEQTKAQSCLLNKRDVRIEFALEAMERQTRSDGVKQDRSILRGRLDLCLRCLSKTSLESSQSEIMRSGISMSRKLS